MSNSSSRSQILESIKAALGKNREETMNVSTGINAFFNVQSGSDIGLFERTLKHLQGNFLSCKNFDVAMEHINQFHKILLQRTWCCTLPDFCPAIERAGATLTDDVLLAEVVVTDCECLIARTGSVVLSAAQSSGRALPVYAPVHIIIAGENQLLHDTDVAISFLLGKYGDRLPSSLYFVAGPSRTGDIEKTLVTGVHGPKDVFVFLVEERIK